MPSDLYVPSSYNLVMLVTCMLSDTCWLQFLWQKLGGEPALYHQCSLVFLCCVRGPQAFMAFPFF